MLVHSPENTRQEWSMITDPGILRPGDELQIVGIDYMATAAVLDSHNPCAELEPTPEQLLGLQKPFIDDHHHILVQFEGENVVMPLGLWGRAGDPDGLLFRHISRRFFDDQVHDARQRIFYNKLGSGLVGLYFMSDDERLSSTPQGRLYAHEGRRLII
jgi:hypothetical protein